MKKSLLRTVLCLCLVAALFAGMASAAFADGNTQTYTLKKGDTVAAVCKKLGIDFDKYQSWITAYNNIVNYANLSIGQVIVLPANNSIALASLPVRTTPTGSTTVVVPTYSGSTANTISYTLKNGDNVSAVCAALKIDFNKYRDWITAYNNIVNYNNLKVGRVIYLPKNNDVALSALPAPASSAPVTPVVPGSVTPSAVPVYGGDFVVSYLINYTLRSGDTIYGVCRALGISFDANYDMITKLNNITNPKALKVGQTLVFPSASAPASGSYWQVVAHRVLSGETTVGICRSYGFNYAPNEAKIRALNGNINPAVIKAGQILYIPVPSGTVVPGGGGSVTPASDTRPSYAMRTSSNGTFSLVVNGGIVSEAKVGDLVRVVANPDPGFYLEKIVITKYGSSETVTVNSDNTFTMPDFPITIVVHFKAVS